MVSACLMTSGYTVVTALLWQCGQESLGWFEGIALAEMWPRQPILRSNAIGFNPLFVIFSLFTVFNSFAINIYIRYIFPPTIPIKQQE